VRSIISSSKNRPCPHLRHYLYRTSLLSSRMMMTRLVTTITTTTTTTIKAATTTSITTTMLNRGHPIPHGAYYNKSPVLTRMRCYVCKRARVMSLLPLRLVMMRTNIIIIIMRIISRRMSRRLPIPPREWPWLRPPSPPPTPHQGTRRWRRHVIAPKFRLLPPIRKALLIQFQSKERKHAMTKERPTSRVLPERSYPLHPIYHAHPV